MLKVGKPQFPKYEKKSDEFVAKVFLDRSGILGITGTISISLVYTVDIVTTRNVFRTSQ